MTIRETFIKDLFVIQPTIHSDDRGYFMETFREDLFNEKFPGTGFVQDNEAMSSRGVIRGLHYQTGDDAQAKLVRIIRGAVWDVALDIRPDSETYGRWYGIRLDAENKKQLFVPRGCAHGYAVLTDETIFAYKCDNYYAPDSEGGIAFDDPSLDIDWKLPENEIQVSDKDRKWPEFGQHKS